MLANTPFHIFLVALVNSTVVHPLVILLQKSGVLNLDPKGTSEFIHQND